MNSYWQNAIDDYCQHLKLERGLAELTIAAYRRDLCHLCGQLYIVRRESLSARDINQYIKSLMAAGRRPATIARKLSAIKRFLGYLVETGRLKSNPAEDYQAPKISRYHPDYLSPEEIARIIEAVDPAGRFEFRDRALIEMFYGSGLRISEAISLKVGDFEFEAGFVRVTGKGKKQRLVPLSGPASQAVRRWLDKREALHPESGHLFVNRFGRSFSRVGIWKIVQKLVTRAGIFRRVTPHTFRHSFATHLIEGGADLRIVQEMLGHADISTTEIYTRIDRDYIIAEHRKHHPRELAGIHKS